MRRSRASRYQFNSDALSETLTILVSETPTQKFRKERGPETRDPMTGPTMPIPSQRATLVTIPKQIRLILVDDHTVLREGLRATLAAESDIEVVAEAAGGLEGLEAVIQHKPDVVVADIEMPEIDGIELTRRIGELDHGTRISLRIPRSWTR